MQFPYSTLTHSLTQWMHFFCLHFGKTVNGITIKSIQYLMHNPQYDFQLKSDTKLKGFFCRLLHCYLRTGALQAQTHTHTPNGISVNKIDCFLCEFVYRSRRWNDNNFYHECWNEWKINKILASCQFPAASWIFSSEIQFLLFYFTFKFACLFSQWWFSHKQIFLLSISIYECECTSKLFSIFIRRCNDSF